MGTDLFWYLLEHLLGQITALHCLPKLYELHNVSVACTAVVVSEHAAIAIKFFHSAEVSIANSDNDDRGRQSRQLDQELLRPWHIVDATVSQEQKDLVDWSALSGRLDTLKELLEEWSEEGGPAESDLRKRLPVGSKHIRNGYDVRALWITIHCKAVAHTVQAHVPRDASKAEEWECFIHVIRLDDLTNVVDRSFVLVVLTKVVQRA